MIKLAFKIYSATAILSPWIFLGLRLTGHYNFIGKNSYIFIGLFILSLITMFLVYDDKKAN